MLVIYGCKKNDNPVSVNNNLQLGLNGQVNDSQGNPVAGCGVHYIFTTVSSSLAKVGKTCPSTNIQYSVPYRTKVTIELLRWFTRDSITTLVNDTLNAGTYSLLVNMTQFTNGIYILQSKVDTNILEMRILYLNTDTSSLVKSTPLTTTNSSGSFNLPYGIFGFEVPLIQETNGSSAIDTVYISHTIQMVVYKEGYATAMKTITVDESKGMNETFVLQRQ